MVLITTRTLVKSLAGAVSGAYDTIVRGGEDSETVEGIGDFVSSNKLDCGLGGRNEMGDK